MLKHLSCYPKTLILKTSMNLNAAAFLPSCTCATAGGRKKASQTESSRSGASTRDVQYCSVSRAKFCTFWVFVSEGRRFFVTKN